MTEHTVTNLEDLMAELDTVREEGIAFSREESTEGLNAVGAPISEPDGSPLGAISVCGPAHRLRGPRLEEEIPDLLRGVTHELELNFKYSD
jgi:DNA-binding IclR family transcriptional regulator